MCHGDGAVTKPPSPWRSPRGVVAQEDLVVNDLEVLGEGKGGPGLLGEVGVLEEGRVVAARREHHGHAARGDEVHDVAQESGVVAVVANPVLVKEAWVCVALDVAHEEGVARTRGDAEVVLEDPPAPVLALHEVLAGDVRVDARGRRHAVHLGEVSPRGVDELLRDHAVADDALVGVDVAQEGVERAHALLEAGLKTVELVRGDESGDGVVGEEPVMVGPVAIDAKAHAVARELSVDGLLPLHEVVGEPAGRRLCYGCPRSAASCLPEQRSNVVLRDIKRLVADGAPRRNRTMTGGPAAAPRVIAMSHAHTELRSRHCTSRPRGATMRA